MTTSKHDGKKDRTVIARVWQDDTQKDRTVLARVAQDAPPKHEVRVSVSTPPDDGLQRRGRYLIRRSDEKDLKFAGMVQAAVSSQGNGAFGEAARGWRGRGALDRWRELVVYFTSGNAMVLHEARMTRNGGEVDKHRALVVPDDGRDGADHDKVVEFFGRDALAKQLYDAMGIDDAEEIA